MDESSTGDFLENAKSQLNLAAFSKWAKEEGGQLELDDYGNAAYVDQSDDDELKPGKKPPTGVKVLRHKIDEATIEQDKVILRGFAQHVASLNAARATTNQDLFDLEDTVQLENAFHGWPDELARRGLKPSTIERYLVATRRYARFRGIKGPMFTVSGPFNRRRRGPENVITAERFQSWLEAIADTERIRLATWLLVAGCPVSKLTSLRFGIEVHGKGETRKITGVSKDSIEVPAPLEEILANLKGRSPKGQPVLRSATDPEASIEMPTLRQVWNRFRYGTGPTMRDVHVLGRHYYVDLKDGQVQLTSRTLPKPAR